MSMVSKRQRRAVAWVASGVTWALVVSAVAAIGIDVFLASRLEDGEALESPLILSVARQLSHSPWELYGPFGGSNPLVLIHAPLYYRLAALLAWPMARAGLDLVTAAMAAGRTLSLLGLALNAAAAYRLARLDGAPARAGWLAVSLLVTAPVVGAFPFIVRPDMLGVSLQTTGVLFVLSALRFDPSRKTPLLAAFALFGLAFCVKQHLVAGALVSTCLLLAGWRRGEVALRSIERGLLTAFAIVLVVYGTEELATGGRMSQAVFVTAANAARVHPAGWVRFLALLMAVTGQSSGLIALLLASYLTMFPVNVGLGRRAVVAAGTLLVGSIFALAILQIIDAPAWQVVYLFHAIFIAVFVGIPACAFLEPRAVVRDRLDSALWLYLAAEAALMLFLCRSSTGAWLNYAIPSLVMGAVLTARALDRALAVPIPLHRLIPIAVAASIVPIGVVAGSYQSAVARRTENLLIAQIPRELGRPSSEFFFVGRPGDNRIHGRLDLVYDDWLYAVFESMHLAEPRSIWLRHALTAGPVRFVVNTSESPRIDEVGLRLSELGYSRRLSAGPFWVWERIRPPTGSSRGGSQRTASERFGR